MAEISDQDTGLAKIVLGDYQWSVPIETLTTNSSFFRAALEGGFQVITIWHLIYRANVRPGIYHSSCRNSRSGSVHRWQSNRILAIWQMRRN